MQPPNGAQPAPADADISTPDYWNGIYAAEDRPRWDLGHPAPALKHWLDGRRLTGRALVPGCGFGHDARLLAENGLETLGVDFAPLANARARVLHRDVPRLSFRASDMFTLLPEWAGQFDIIFEHTCFVAIEPARRAEYALLLHGLLKPGGLVIGCFYNHGREGGPPFDARREDVLAVFEPLFKIEKLEFTPHSIERRANTELWAEFRRP